MFVFVTHVLAWLTIAHYRLDQTMEVHYHLHQTMEVQYHLNTIKIWRGIPTESLSSSHHVLPPQLHDIHRQFLRRFLSPLRVIRASSSPIVFLNETCSPSTLPSPIRVPQASLATSPATTSVPQHQLPASRLTVCCHRLVTSPGRSAPLPLSHNLSSITYTSWRLYP